MPIYSSIKAKRTNHQNYTYDGLMMITECEIIIVVVNVSITIILDNNYSYIRDILLSVHN